MVFLNQIVGAEDDGDYEQEYKSKSETITELKK